MSRDQWYRRKSWTADDRADFFTRLARTRSSFNKAQRARIQAFELQQSGNPTLVEAALGLLDMILEHWSSDAQLAWVLHQRADCLCLLGRNHEVAGAYHDTFEEQRRNPFLISNAHFDFAWWVAVSRREEHYDEALSVLDEFTGNLIFPATIYRSDVPRALIFDARGEHERAAECARRALRSAEITDSGFRYHPNVGLVTIVDNKVHERIRKLASKPRWSFLRTLKLC